MTIVAIVTKRQLLSGGGDGDGCGGCGGGDGCDGCDSGSGGGGGGGGGYRVHIYGHQDSS